MSQIEKPAGGNGGQRPGAGPNALYNYNKNPVPVNCLQAALSYAERGWAVLPLRPRSKEPLTTHGVKDATTDVDTIKSWWQRWPEANVGIATGSSSGLLVVDVDPRHDGDIALRDLERYNDPLPETIEALTGGGGRHIFFRWQAGLGCGRLDDGIDIKGEGGYVVAPPSVHPSLRTYEWEVLHTPDAIQLADPPKWMLVLLSKRARVTSAGGNGHASRIPEGQRNVTLTSLAGSMRRKGLSQEAIEAALLAENFARCDPPLDVEEVKRIAASVSRYEPADDTIEADDIGAQQKDYGHAAVLARLFLNRYRWATHRGAWMRYDGRVWRQDVEEHVAKEAADALRQHYAAQLAVASTKEAVTDLSRKVAETCIFTRIKGALAFLKGWENILTLPEQWDNDPWLLNVNNGTLNLQTGELQPHDPADLLTQLAPVDYDPTAQGHRWQQHLETFLPSFEVRRQVQRDLGVSLVGVNLEEILPIWYGTGGNGKSTTLRVLRELLGDYAKMAAPKLLVASSSERHPAELADLYGSRVLFSVEIGNSAKLDEERVKMLTGGENIKARFMRENFFEFRRTWTITLVCNHKPEIRGQDTGIWRRIRLVPWTVALPKERQRPQEEVVRELLAEGPAILAWMVEGLRDWQRVHHWMADAVRVATEAYRAEQDVLGEFLAERCILGNRYEVAKGELYQAYVIWCDRNRERPLSKKAFGTMLRERNITERRGAQGVRLYVGIGLLTQQVAASATSVSTHVPATSERAEKMPPSGNTTN